MSKVNSGPFFLQAHEVRPRWSWLLWPAAALCLFADAGAYLGLTRFEILKLPGADKVLHFALFGSFALMLVGWRGRRSPLLPLVLLAAAGTVDELAQYFAPGRSFDLGDLACTLSGIACCGWLGRRAVARWAQRAAQRGAEIHRSTLRSSGRPLPPDHHPET